jgi:hypothetical protein
VIAPAHLCALCGKPVPIVEQHAREQRRDRAPVARVIWHPPCWDDDGDGLRVHMWNELIPVVEARGPDRVWRAK